MTSLAIDRDSRIASIGAGVRWNAVIEAASTLGLAPIAGSATDVGAIGYTLGGGVGPLARTYGVSADYVRALDVVTADGKVRRANAKEHPDLFWALCGGKGGLGIVASMDFELVELPRLYAGGLFFSAEHIDAALRAWAGWTASVPESVNSSVAVIRFPKIEAVPAFLRGRTALHVRYAFGGDPADGPRFIEPLRRAAPVLNDSVREMPAREIGTIHNDPPGPLPAWSYAVMLRSIDQDFVTTLMDSIGPGIDIPLVAVEVRHLGGRAARGPREGNAVGSRRSPFLLSLIGAPNPELFESELPRFALAAAARLGPWLSGETTINFGYPLRGREHYENAWPREIRERLEQIRKRYDPTGIFLFPPRIG
jgi:hypothetical protein